MSQDKRTQTVTVHRNLHKKCWSIRAGRKPVRHAKSLTIVGCVFRVQQGGRAAVLRERVRRVHAFAVGTLVTTEPVSADMVCISYNPYRNPDRPGSFYRRDTNEDVSGAELLVFCVDGSVWAKGVK